MRVAAYAGAKLITDGLSQDVADGTDETAGGLRTADYGGLRSGVNHPTDATLLAYAGGPGVNSITAESHP